MPANGGRDLIRRLKVKEVYTPLKERPVPVLLDMCSETHGHRYMKQASH